MEVPTYVKTMIEDFAASSTTTKLELPVTLTVEERKQAKKFVSEHPSLTCESFGFGAERQMHVFKQTPSLNVPGVRVRNTFIDDWVGPQDDGPQFRSMPLPTTIFPKVPEDCPKVISLEPPAELSEFFTQTATAGKSNTTTEEWLPKVPEGGLTYTVRDTFIHIDCDDEDAVAAEERSYKSMPHGCFAKHLAEDLAAKEAKALEAELMGPTPPSSPLYSPAMYFAQERQNWSNEERQTATNGTVIPIPPSSPPCPTNTMQFPQQPLPTGTAVAIQGLTKLTSFNGHAGTIQEYDPVTLRYKVVLSSGSGGPRVAKVKLENLQHSFHSTPPPPAHHAHAPTLLSMPESNAFECKSSSNNSSMLLATGPVSVKYSERPRAPAAARVPAEDRVPAADRASAAERVPTAMPLHMMPLSLNGLV